LKGATEGPEAQIVIAMFPGREATDEPISQFRRGGMVVTVSLLRSFGISVAS
jgi:hypothetical protein